MSSYQGIDVLQAPQKSSHTDNNRPAKAAVPGKMLAYTRRMGIDAYLKQVNNATPMQIIEIERAGVAGAFIADLSSRMDLPSSRVFTMLRIPKATAARKMAEGSIIDGRAGQAAVGMVKLLGMAQDIASESTAKQAKDFDSVKWLGLWIEQPQASLGGRKPADLLDTPTGVEMVARVLGSIQSGAYQ